MSRYRFPVLNAALEIHGHVTGSSDVLSYEETAERVEFLRGRLKLWHAPNPRSSRAFDNAVEAVVREAVREWEAGEKP